VWLNYAHCNGWWKIRNFHFLIEEQIDAMATMERIDYSVHCCEKGKKKKEKKLDGI